MFDSYIAYHARSRPAAPAVVAVDGSLTFKKFNDDINRAVAELSELHATVGESVSVAVAKPYLEWVLVMALARRGIATAPSSDLATQLRIGDGTDRSGSASLVLDPSAIKRIFHGPAQSMRQIRPDKQALARVLQSSGTTGERKRLGMSWAVIDAAIRNAPVAYGSPEGPWLASTGIGTILGLVVTLACWAAGNPAVLGMDGNLRPDLLAVVRPRLIALVPDQLSQLLDALPDDYEKRPLRIISSSGSVPPALAERTRLRLTNDLRSVYGASETGSVAIADLSLLEREAGAAGYVLPLVDVEIVDEVGNPRPAGALGQLRIRSNRLVDHFRREEPEKADAFRNGWFYSADLGRIREDGLLLIEGRTDDVMNLAGHKVLPGWVEQAAASCLGVTDVAAFSLPDQYGLERCWLAVVTTPDFTRANLSEALRDQLKWVEKIQLLLVDRLPRNHTGKVQRDRLRQLALTVPMSPEVD